MTATLLSTENLCKYFGGVKAVHNVNIHVDKGEILGVIGPNGAGKTTLFNVISGFFRPTSGKIFFEGRPIHGLTASKIARLGIARTFQVVRPFKNLTVLQNVLAACGRHQYSKLSFISTWNKREYLKEAEAIIKDVGLEKFKNNNAGMLPLGYQRRLEIARALALHPKMLLLDEPTSGMSYDESSGIMNLIRRLRDEGITIMLIEHNMRVAMNLSDRIYVLNHGFIIAEGKPEDVVSDPKVIEAYLGVGYATQS